MNSPISVQFTSRPNNVTVSCIHSSRTGERGCTSSSALCVWEKKKRFGDYLVFIVFLYRLQQGLVLEFLVDRSVLRRADVFCFCVCVFVFCFNYCG